MIYAKTLAFLAWPLLLAIFLQGGMANRKSNSQRKSVAGRTSTRRINKMQTGTWGGQHIRLEVTEDGAKIEYDCAHGTVDGRIEADRNNRFDVRGTHVIEAGGPVSSDAKPNIHPARYTGRIEGKTMTLTVTLTDTNETIGTFSLTHGEQPELTKCA